MNTAFSNLTSPSKGLLIVIGAVGLLAGVMAAQATLAPTPAPIASSTTTSTPSANGTAPPTAVAPPAQGAQSGGARIVMMVTVLGGLGLAWVFMRKRQTAKHGKDGPAMSLVGQLRVGGRWQVALVKVPGKTLVLGATDKGLNLLTTIEEGDLEAQAELRRLDRESTQAFATHDPALPDLPDLPDLPGLAAARESNSRPRTNRPYAERDTTDRDLPDLDALLTGEDRVNVRTPSSPQLSRPLTRPPEPFARLLDELNQLPRQSSATGPIPTAQRDRMRTPEASALRARLERYQGPTN